MGTTFVGCVLREKKAWFGWIGESRGYLVRRGELQATTSDHSLLNELIRTGRLSDHESEHFQHENVITEPDPSQAWRDLVDEANRNGGLDNITVPVARYSASPRRSRGRRISRIAVPAVLGALPQQDSRMTGAFRIPGGIRAHLENDRRRVGRHDRPSAGLRGLGAATMVWVAPLAVLLALPVLGVIRNAVAQRGSDRLAAACGQALARTAGGTQSGNVVGFGRHSLALTVAIESVKNNSTNATIAGTIRVSCDLDGRSMPSLTAASQGVGATREDALDQAVEGCVFEFGIPIAKALIEKGPPPHALSIAVLRRPGRDLEGEFSVDGEPSQRLNDLAMRAKWPESSGSYLLKQYYVLMPAAEAQQAR